MTTLARAPTTKCTSSVNKSSSPTDNSKQQDTPPTTNIQSSTEPITPTTTVTTEENNTDNQAEIQVDNAHVDDNEFYNVFITPVRKQAESSSRYFDPSNMHTFYQPHQYEHRWKKDHPLLKFVEIHPSQCKSYNNLQQILKCELVDKPFGKTVIKLKWLWKNKRDENQTVIHNKTQLVAKGYAHEEGVYVAQPDGFVDPDHPEKLYHLRKALYRLKQAPRAWYDELSNFLMSKGFTKGTIDPTLFTIRYGEDILLVQIYVDDIIFGSTNPKYSKRFEKLMHSRFEMSLMGEMKFFLGLQIHQSPRAFSDADHVGCLDTRKNTSGSIQFLGDKLVSWMSKKHICTTMSSAKAEYVALSISCAQVMWMRTHLKDYGFNYNKIPLYYDSQSAIAISYNPVQHSHTKHIHTRYHFIKEQVENSISELYFVRTEYQLADMFTKALPEDRFQYIVRQIGMRCLTLAELEVLTNESA
ncbi:retrovirus-related pol polyprotein from transposon TNT 1-94 [Tanacetum coccineum]